MLQCKRKRYCVKYDRPPSSISEGNGQKSRMRDMQCTCSETHSDDSKEEREREATPLLHVCSIKHDTNVNECKCQEQAVTVGEEEER